MLTKCTFSLQILGKGKLFDMIRWMQNEKVIEKTYNWAGENCKCFAQQLFNLLAQSVQC